MPDSNPPRAAQMQAPPPEEAEELPTVQDPTYIAAHRLALANMRERQVREMQVDGQSVAMSRPRHVTPVWMDLARTLIRADISNFERFIHVQYRYSVPADETLSVAPNPTTFKGPKALKRYLDYNKRADNSMLQALQSYQLEFECCVGEAANAFPDYTDQQLWNFVLMNKMYELPALYRYCIAHSEQLHEAERAHRAAALTQFLMDPIGYSRTWGAMIPKVLKDEATGILMFAP